MGERIHVSLSPAQVRRIILADVPRELLEKTVRCIYGSCRAAELLSKPFPAQIRCSVFPIVRRAFIERDWKALAADFPDVKASFRANKRGTSYYAKLSVGRVVLTESHVNYPGSLPRESSFRRRLSCDNQGHLLKQKGSRVYGIITYGATDQRKPLWGQKPKRFRDLAVAPTFMNIVSPSPDYTRQVMDPIDLMQEFSGVISSVNNGPIEEIANQTLVSIENLFTKKRGGDGA